MTSIPPTGIRVAWTQPRQLFFPQSDSVELTGSDIRFERGDENRLQDFALYFASQHVGHDNSLHTNLTTAAAALEQAVQSASFTVEPDFASLRYPKRGQMSVEFDGKSFRIPMGAAPQVLEAAKAVAGAAWAIESREG